MECGPPLNLTTTVKVEELKALVPEDVEPRDFTVEGELIEDSVEKKQDAYSDDDPQENTDDDDAQENGEHRLALDEKDGETSLPHNESSSPKNPIYGAEKSYKCPECNLCYSRASQLRAHERTHFEEQVNARLWYCMVTKEGGFEALKILFSIIVIHYFLPSLKGLAEIVPKRTSVQSQVS